VTLDDPPEGDWYAVLADTPLHAFVHVRDHEPQSASGGEECSDCHVLVKGRFKNQQETVAAARSSGS
jgi:hypothetical protein